MKRLNHLNLRSTIFFITMILAIAVGGCSKSLEGDLIVDSEMRQDCGSQATCLPIPNDGPTDPIPPSTPQDPNTKIPPLPHKTDFLTAGCYTHVSPGMNSQQRQQCIQNMVTRNYTHMYVYVMNEMDYSGNVKFDFYQNPGAYRQILQEILDAGLAPVVWLVPDDAPVMRNRTTAQIQNMFNNLIPEIDDLVSSYVLGLELDEYWDANKVNALGTHLNTLTDNLIAVHQVPVNYQFAKFAWADYAIIQYGFNRSSDFIRSETTRILADLKKPIVAGEYSLTNESQSKPLGDAGVMAGASGFGNGGTP